MDNYYGQLLWTMDNIVNLNYNQASIIKSMFYNKINK